VTYLPYADGTEVCNIFWAETDCQTVQDGKLHAYLMNGEAKVWIPKSDLTFNNGLEFIQ